MNKLRIKCDRFFCGFRIDAADDPVVVHELVDYIARQDTLRTVGDEDLLLQFRAGTENQILHFLRCSHRRRGFNHI